MPKLTTGGDFNEIREALMRPLPQGGFVTPGAAVNVNVAPAVVPFGDGTVVQSAGATNLATAAPGDAGTSVVYAIVINKTGTISAVAGTAATTGEQVAPEVDEDTYALLANVTVANGDAAVAQAAIDNGARNLL